MKGCRASISIYGNRSNNPQVLYFTFPGDIERPVVVVVFFDQISPLTRPGGCTLSLIYFMTTKTKTNSHRHVDSDCLRQNTRNLLRSAVFHLVGGA